MPAGGLLLVVYASSRMDNLTFCDFRAPQFKAMCDLLGTTFNTSQTELNKSYQLLISGFKDDHIEPTFTHRSFFTSLDENFQTKYNQADIVASDLPSLLSRGGQRTVMIVAQDALSKEPAPEQIRLGTPFAMHSKWCRERFPTTKRYFQLIDVLLDRGFQVYLTDLHKVYVRGAGLSKGAGLPKEDKKRFSAVLREEIKLINPEAVMTWGKKAGGAITELKINRPHHTYPHPSAANGRTLAKIIGRPVTTENIIDHWTKYLAPRLRFQL